MMWQSILFIGISLSAVHSQIPSLGRCPEFDPMADFSREKFLGAWYEFERYFTATEVLSKCIAAVYERRADGKIYVNNHYTNRISNVQRIISGKMLEKLAKEENSKLTVSYDAFPVNYNTTNLVLDTDYENYAVLWSCSNIGPVGHTESAWLLSRVRIPQGEVLQAAYGVLDKYKLNRTFFVKTQQTDCETEAPVVVDDSSPLQVKSNKTEQNKNGLDKPGEDDEGVFIVEQIKKENSRVNNAPIDDVNANQDFF